MKRLDARNKTRKGEGNIISTGIKSVSPIKRDVYLRRFY